MGADLYPPVHLPQMSLKDISARLIIDQLARILESKQDFNFGHLRAHVVLVKSIGRGGGRLRGVRDRNILSFTKFVEQSRNLIDYKGSANKKLCLIESLLQVDI